MNYRATYENRNGRCRKTAQAVCLLLMLLCAALSMSACRAVNNTESAMESGLDNGTNNNGTDNNGTNDNGTNGGGAGAGTNDAGTNRNETNGGAVYGTDQETNGTDTSESTNSNAR